LLACFAIYSRLIVPLYGKNNKRFRKTKEAFVFIATQGEPRRDKKPNQHRMFKNVYKREDNMPYFEEVRGPWIDYFGASCAISADFSHDKLDDLIICNDDGYPMLVEQPRGNGNWREHSTPKEEWMLNWANARVAEVTGDNIPDLIVTTGGLRLGEGEWGPAILYIFKGIRSKPYFDFRAPHYEQKLKYAAPDLEIMDVNEDGLPDIYVVQVDMESGYCADYPNDLWGGGSQPPDDFVPPVDRANDLLFMGTRNSGKQAFRRKNMRHAYPGCGWLVQKFGDDKTMVLAQGNNGHPGHNMVLKW
jgi:hypothetical protein